jgi:manganese/zinc/iron transport system ATP- binding protein
MDEPFAGVDAATEKAIVNLMKTMSKQGKTVVVVHHDLQSAREYFDWAVLLNLRLVASGPVTEVMTTELLQETYGGKLTLLAEVGALLTKKQFPSREEK